MNCYNVIQCTRGEPSRHLCDIMSRDDVDPRAAVFGYLKKAAAQPHRRDYANDEEDDDEPLPHHHHAHYNQTTHPHRRHTIPDHERRPLMEGQVEEVVMAKGWKIGTDDDVAMVDVFIIDETYQTTRQLQFWITIVELTMAIAFMFVGALVVSDAFDVNTYVFVIVGSILSVVVILFIHVSAIIKTWSRSSGMSHTHFNTVTAPVIAGIIVQGVSFFCLGLWVSDNCTCCETANCQPDPLDFAGLTRFYVSWAILIGLNAVWALFVYRALIAHIYPEAKVPTTADPSRTKTPLAFQHQQHRADAMSQQMGPPASRMAREAADRQALYK